MPEKPRKNQGVLSFLENLKKQLSDENSKNFGLYMLLYKRHGQKAMEEALAITLHKGIPEKFRYFLGVLHGNARERNPEKPKTYKETTTPIDQEGLDKYNELKRALLQKLTPKYQKSSRTRTGIYRKLAKQERKQKRNKS